MIKKDVKSKKFKPTLAKISKSYSCFIDCYENGKFHGWAINDLNSSMTVNLELYAGNEPIGSGICNIYREDLKDAGVGDGYHGFSIEPSTAGVPFGKHTIHAICDHDFKIKDLFSWELQGICTPYIDDVNAMMISGSFQFSHIAEAQIEYQVLIDDSVILTSFTDPTDPTLHKFDCRIPDEYFDGNPHVISIKMLEDKTSSSTIQILSPILTPWSHFKQSKKNGASTTSYYSGMPAIMTRRLSALINRIEPLLKSNSIKEIKKIYKAYEILSNSTTDLNEYHQLVMRPSEKNPSISIIIPVHNQFSVTYECLASLLLYSNNCNYEIIIVDDASTDKTMDINHIIKNITVVKNENNIGFLKSCNIGAKFANGEYLVFLNNDTEVGEYWLDEMLDVFRRVENVGIVGCKLIFPNGILQEAGGVVWENGEPWNLGRDDSPMLPEWNYVRQVDYVSGAALMIPKNIWNTVKGFSEEFAPCYFEDTDLAYKVRNLGHKVIYTPHAEVIHHEGISNGTDLSKGLKKHQALNQPLFSSKWIRLLENNGRVGKDLWKNKERGVRYRALVIDSETPQPDKNAGSYAAVQEIKLLQSFGFKVTFIPENLAHFGKYTTELQKLGVECQHAPFTSSIEELLKKKGDEYDLVYITRYHVAEKHLDAIKKYTHAKIILNSADLHFLRELRSALYKNEEHLTPTAIETRNNELGIMQKMDVVLSYSESEQAVITSHILKSSNIFKCPWVLPLHSSKNSYKQRSGIAFLGGYKHLPNIEAVEFLVKKIMPILLERNPKIKLYIYGSNIPKAFDEYIGENIDVVGHVEDLESIFEQHRIFVAPLFSGAGIKGKVLDAISWGTPTVLSPIAMEATGLVNGISALLAESENEWVEAILKLYSNESLWDKLTKNSLELAATAYSFENARQQFSKPLNYLGFFS